MAIAKLIPFVQKPIDIDKPPTGSERITIERIPRGHHKLGHYIVRIQAQERDIDRCPWVYYEGHLMSTFEMERKKNPHAKPQHGVIHCGRYCQIYKEAFRSDSQMYGHRFPGLFQLYGANGVVTFHEKSEEMTCFYNMVPFDLRFLLRRRRELHLD
ncbi:uncharacterized protein BO97DRAFT_427940 [Aspergillus homomorphus CBS 101889]|uniref:Uncharacterized protein n=1 Tax=Aspergillus homomorphus (strain CBS 101889) TaxID=1450537 RepID=A0A395HLM9_ASPHC|nr:hypothetical protein BO97DRAFT_427940 [Aspergillus homomorphus CBS 101889]RAL08841.1 hypothetical protein BO97DRAFT_427940 [Aspergillus homomorphus CBS 101889]